MSELVEVTCGGCGCSFAIAERRYAELKKTGETFYCPNGHPRVFTVHPTKEEKEIERLRDQRDAAWERAGDAYEEARRAKQLSATCPLCGDRTGRSNMLEATIRARLVAHLADEHGARPRLRAIPEKASAGNG